MSAEPKKIESWDRVAVALPSGKTVEGRFVKAREDKKGRLIVEIWSDDLIKQRCIGVQK